MGNANLSADLLLVFLGKADEMVVFGAYEKGDGSLVEASPLPIPFFDTVERALSCQIEHE